MPSFRGKSVIIIPLKMGEIVAANTEDAETATRPVWDGSSLVLLPRSFRQMGNSRL